MIWTWESSLARALAPDTPGESPPGQHRCAADFSGRVGLIKIVAIQPGSDPLLRVY
jgi:hypothetical protein